MKMTSLLELSPEVLQNVAVFLSVDDLCQLRLTCSYLRDVCDLESVWSSRVKDDFGYKEAIDGEDGVTVRSFYQKLLYKHKYLFSEGSPSYWQRTDLPHYGGLIRARICGKKKAILLDNLLAPKDIYDDLKDVNFLQIQINSRHEIVIKNQDSFTFNVPPTLKEGEDVEGGVNLNIIYQEIPDVTTSPADWRKLLTSFADTDSTDDPELGLMKFVTHYHSRAFLTFTPAFTSAWTLSSHCGHQSASSILQSIPPGLFKGTYVAHGVELIHVLDGQGVKVTGDPNVPFQKITFRVTHPKRLDLTPDQQRSSDEINTIVEGIADQFFPNNFENPFVEDDDDRESFPFHVPDNMRERQEIRHRECRGRWAAEAQIAGHMYQHPEFIPANLIIFNDDQIAVMFLGFLNSISIYHRANLMPTSGSKEPDE